MRFDGSSLLKNAGILSLGTYRKAGESSQVNPEVKFGLLDEEMLQLLCAAAKAGIWSATRVAAKENAEHDILINMIIPGPTNTSIWGKDMPHLQKPEATFPTAKLLASLERGGPTGKVYWDEKEYQMFNQNNSILKK